MEPVRLRLSHGRIEGEGDRAMGRDLGPSRSFRWGECEALWGPAKGTGSAGGRLSWLQKEANRSRAGGPGADTFWAAMGRRARAGSERGDLTPAGFEPSWRGHFYDQPVVARIHMKLFRHYWVKTVALALAVVFAGGGGLVGANTQAEGDALPVEAAAMPFVEGERLTYSLRWGIIRAGVAVLEVQPMTEYGGEEVHHFSLSIRTTRFVDTFYKVRDRIDGFARRDMDGSVLYLLKKEEGRNLRDVRVVYDQEGGWAQYSNFGEEQEPVEILPSTFDPLSVMFAMRTFPLVEHSEIRLPISDGRRTSMGVGRVREGERVRVPSGRYDTVLVEPDMRDVGGVFDKSGDAPLRIWFSNDEQRMPVRISSRVAVGSFHADLVAVEQVTDGEEADLAKLVEN